MLDNCSLKSHNEHRGIFLIKYLFSWFLFWELRKFHQKYQHLVQIHAHCGFCELTGTKLPSNQMIWVLIFHDFPWSFQTKITLNSLIRYFSSHYIINLHHKRWDLFMDTVSIVCSEKSYHQSTGYVLCKIQFQTRFPFWGKPGKLCVAIFNLHTDAQKTRPVDTTNDDDDEKSSCTSAVNTGWQLLRCWGECILRFHIRILPAHSQTLAPSTRDWEEKRQDVYRTVS